MIKQETLAEIKQRFAEVNDLMSQPEVATDPVQMRDLNRERGRLQQLVHVINRYESAVGERADLKEMIQADHRTRWTMDDHRSVDDNRTMDDRALR